ncbi:hypothetical protein Tco_0747212 [Tanacetum coccineum]
MMEEKKKNTKGVRLRGLEETKERKECLQEVRNTKAKGCEEERQDELVKWQDQGDHVLQYSMLRDYVVELQSTSPNTAVKIALERNTDSSYPTRVFKRIYVCFRALGFRACKRELLSLDGAFMKGPFLGQVLAAVGLDSTNKIYPLTYGLFEVEMIDKRSAFSTSVKEFEMCMLDLKKMNHKAHEWLNNIPPEHLARSLFQVFQDSWTNHVGFQDSRKSTSGSAQFLGEKLILWMRSQLTDYGFEYSKIPLYYDSKSTIALSCNTVQHSRMKHIAVRYHFIKEQVKNEIVELYFVKTTYQLADIFKALARERFEFLVKHLGMQSITPKELKHLAKSDDDEE